MDTLNADTVNSTKTAEARDYPARPFPTQTFYDLLVAEVAGTRGNLALSLENYRQQARVTKDPGVIARAVAIATYQKHNQALQELGHLWLTVEPNNVHARNLGFFAFIQDGNYTAAFEHALYLLDQNDSKALISLPSYVTLSSEQERINLLQLYAAAEKSRTNNSDLLLGKTRLLAQLGRTDEAISLAKNILGQQPQHEPTRLTLTQLLHENQQDKDAIKVLEKGLKYQPESMQLQLQLIRLVAEDNLPLAIQKMTQLIEQQGGNDTLEFALALLHRENDNRPQARKIYQSFIAKNQQSSQAHYQLAMMDEQDHLLESALAHYYHVTDNTFFLPATVRLTQILTALDRLNDARLYLHTLRGDLPSQSTTFYLLESELLTHEQRHQSAQALMNEALAQRPSDIDLLYNRSMINEKLGNLDAVESDLRAILQQDANNVSALNALGYTLANGTERYDEALELIQHAIRIKPNDPAIRDSLGWVLFKRGDYAEAIVQLRAAMSSMPDPEVAAHLGEALWTTGAEAEARAIWQGALDKAPRSPFLLDTLKRLSIEL